MISFTWNRVCFVENVTTQNKCIQICTSFNSDKKSFNCFGLLSFFDTQAHTYTHISTKYSSQSMKCLIVSSIFGANDILCDKSFIFTCLSISEMYFEKCHVRQTCFRWIQLMALNNIIELFNSTHYEHTCLKIDKNIVGAFFLMFHGAFFMFFLFLRFW